MGRNKYFGKRAFCEAYLQKRKLIPVYSDEKEERNAASGYNLHYEAEDGNIPITQIAYIINDDETFDGIIIGQKKVPTKYDFDYIDDNICKDIWCYKYEYIDCYIVATGMNRRRFVPKTYVREIV